MEKCRGSRWTAVFRFGDVLQGCARFEHAPARKTSDACGAGRSLCRLGQDQGPRRPRSICGQSRFMVRNGRQGGGPRQETPRFPDHGVGALVRRNGPGQIERTLRDAGAKTYLIVFGTNATGGYDELDSRFDSLPRPAIVELAGSWAGDLPAMPVLFGGMAPPTPLKLATAADALLYVGPRDSLTQLFMPRSELEGTPYGKEMARRIGIQTGREMNFLHDSMEAPLFERPHPSTGGPAPLPPPPKSMHDPLPPRPPSR